MIRKVVRGREAYWVYIDGKTKGKIRGRQQEEQIKAYLDAEQKAGETKKSFLVKDKPEAKEFWDDATYNRTIKALEHLNELEDEQRAYQR